MKLSSKTLIMIFLSLLLLCLGAVGWMGALHPSGSMVRVRVDGAEYGQYPLNADAVVRIAPPDGAWYNTLSICSGTVRITSSDCPSQVCVHTPAITETIPGVITCLPHRLTVELTQ